MYGLWFRLVIRMIWMDVHEGAALKQQLKSQAESLDPPVEILETPLPIADFVFPEKNTAIEHKRWPDFVGSTVSGRLKEQLYNMASNYQNCFLIISGERTDIGDNSIHPHSISGSIVSVATKHRIPIIWAKDDEDIAYCVLRCYAKVDEPLKPFIDSAKRLKYSDEQIKVAMLATIPSFGTKRAKKLLESCDWDLKRIATLTEDNVFEVEGMTEGMAFNLLKIFSINKEE